MKTLAPALKGRVRKAHNALHGPMNDRVALGLVTHDARQSAMPMAHFVALAKLAQPESADTIGEAMVALIHGATQRTSTHLSMTGRPRHLDLGNHGYRHDVDADAVPEPPGPVALIAQFWPPGPTTIAALPEHAIGPLASVVPPQT